MKASLFILGISILVIFSANQSAHGLWMPQSPEELLEKSHLVFVGTIESLDALELERSNSYTIEKDEISQAVVENYTLVLDEYTVSVEEFLTNPQDADTMTVRQPTVSTPGRVVPYGGFDIGDRVLFYLENLDDTNTYSRESFKIPQECDAKTVVNQPRIEFRNSFDILQEDISKKDSFVAGMSMNFVISKDMDDLNGRLIDVAVSIRPSGENETVFEKHIRAESEPCTWIASAEWEFTPEKEGDYRMYLNVRENEETDGDTSYTGFSVISKQKSMSPLKQFLSGIAINEIQCRESLTLVTKNDGSPACVRSETKEKLEQRGWAYHKETLLVLVDNRQDIGRYLKQVSILDESSIDATVSYPTNTAHHKMFPDGHQSIVSDCTEKDNDANLSLLYLKEIDNVQNMMTFKVEDKKFDGLRCDDALWQELTRWGYCGPPDYVIPHIDVAVSSVADAQRQVGFVFDVPKYLPEGYDIQKVTVGQDNDRATLYISEEPIIDETQACDFAWGHEGIYLFYREHPEILSFGSNYSDAPGEPQTWPIAINGNPGLAEQRWVGDRFGMPIPQSSDLQVSMPDDGILVHMSSSLSVEELIKIAESISDPIFNSDIIPDYSLASSHTKNNDEIKMDSIPVKIMEKTSKQICNKIKMECNNDHFFRATYDLNTNTATLEQSVSYNNYVLKISNKEICYKINSDPSNYCSFLNMNYSSVLDGNKPVILSQPLDFWRDLSREEQFAYHEEYGDLFFEDLGKMVLKDEIRKELELQNITNANNDFRLHTGMVEESLPPFVYYAAVVNSTDGKSYMFGGRTHTNQVLDVYHEELVFYNDVSAKLPIDSFRNDSPVIVIRPQNESDDNTDKLFMNFDKNQNVTFVNSLSVPLRIQDKGSGNPEKEHELAWIGPTIKPNETWRMQVNSTGYHEWNVKLAPTEPSGWWEPHESGNIIAYSEDMTDVDFHEKLRIAGEFVIDSEIPTNGLGMGNSEGLRIWLNQAIIEMLPDAQTYYTERVKQAIPFDVPIIFLN